MQKNYCHLTVDERRTIYKLLEAGHSKTSIASILGRHRSTIFREIQRNTTYHEDHFHNGYFHVNAQEYYSRRRSKLRKLIQNTDLKSYVIDRLRAAWSPDQIAGYLKTLAIKGFTVSHETIYAFIYSQEGRELQLYRYLHKAYKNRRKRFARKARHLRGLPPELSIRHRPEFIDERDNFGHWEADLMIFRREYGNSNITSLVERKSRYTMLIKNPHRRSEPLMRRIKDKISPLPRDTRQSITFDRGTEFTAWKVIDKALELGPYYCDPRSPWQKGTNENTNGRIRRFLPSNTNINEITERDLKVICNKINHTPRKCLDYRTPHEVFYNHLHQQRDGIVSLT